MILRKATSIDIPIIWAILQEAILQRKLEGSEQWQNGYPNEQTIQNDIKSSHGYVLVNDDTIVAYAAIIMGEEPTYKIIKGKWLTNGNYTVVHRVATAANQKGKGIATHLFRMIEDLSLQQKVFSIKIDTNFDNIPMLKILDKLHYTYCGEITVQGKPRKAFEKVLSKA